MSHLTQLRSLKRAKMQQKTAAARAASLDHSREAAEAVDAVIRDAPVLRECITKPRFFTYNDMAEGGMAFLEPGYRKTGAAYDEAKAAAAAAEAVEHDLGHGYVVESLLVEQLQAMVGGACPTAASAPPSRTWAAACAASGVNSTAETRSGATAPSTASTRGRSSS